MQVAEEAGNSMAANMVMLGALFGTGRVPVRIETIKEAIQERFPPKLASVNVRAFDLGYQKCQQSLT
jgi:indolepyruvate ferredoxin oxidoreductase beta subunit